jgi:hypothetical protein
MNPNVQSNYRAPSYLLYVPAMTAVVFFQLHALDSMGMRAFLT